MPLCDFLLVKNTDLILSPTICQISCSIDQITAFDGCLSIMYLFSETSDNIAISHTMLKLYYLDDISVAESMGLTFT